jgi:serine/threonine-protein kinase SRPK3
MMNGGDIKKAAINKAKQMASVANTAANGNGGKKRRKGADLKPIVTADGPQVASSSSATSSQSALVFYFFFVSSTWKSVLT